MGKSKRKHNWKARLQPDVELSHDQNIEVSDIVDILTLRTPRNDHLIMSGR